MKMNHAPHRLSSPGSIGRIETKRGTERLHEILHAVEAWRIVAKTNTEDELVALAPAADAILTCLLANCDTYRPRCSVPLSTR